MLELICTGCIVVSEKTKKRKAIEMVKGSKLNFTCTFVRRHDKALEAITRCGELEKQGRFVKLVEALDDDHTNLKVKPLTYMFIFLYFFVSKSSVLLSAMKINLDLHGYF